MLDYKIKAHLLKFCTFFSTSKNMATAFKVIACVFAVVSAVFNQPTFALPKQKIENITHKPQYNYAFAVHDEMTKDIKRHTERRDGDRVEGEYSILDADGTTRTVRYHVDGDSGFIATVSRTGHAKHPPSHNSYKSAKSIKPTEEPFTHYEPDIYMQQMQQYDKLHNIGFYKELYQSKKLPYNHKQVQPQQNYLNQYNDVTPYYDSHTYQSPHQDAHSYFSESRGNIYPNTVTKEVTMHQPQQGNQPQGHLQYQYEHTQYTPQNHFDKEKISKDVEQQIRQQIESKDAKGGKQMFDLGDGNRQEMTIEELRSHLMTQLQQEEQKDGLAHSHAEQHQVSQSHPPQTQSDTHIHPQDTASSSKTQEKKRTGLFTPYI